MSLGGLLIVEVVFGPRGGGTLGFEAVQVRDYPVVRGVLFVGAVCGLAANVLVDLARVATDPRIRYS